MNTDGTNVAHLSNELAADLGAIDAKLDRIAGVVDDLDRRMESFDDFAEDLGPIVHGALNIAQHQMSKLEEDGIFEFAGEAVQVGRTIATSFSPEDVRMLGDNVVGILETVRHLTQKDVLVVADKAAGALSRPPDEKPAGTLKLIRELRDPEVRRGMAMLLGVLKEMGENGDGAAVT